MASRLHQFDERKVVFMHKKVYVFLFLIVLLLLAGCNQLPFAKVSSDIEDAVEEAFIEQARENQDEEIVFLFYETQIDYIEFSKDQNQALVWFALLDKETGEINGTEPGLVLAQLTGPNPKDPSSWALTFQHEPEWTTAVWESDPALLTTEEKQAFSGKAQVQPRTSQIYTGYKLPWEDGERAKLSGSIAHVFIYKTCPTTCLYAFDFWTGDMFPVHAAKGGVVKMAVWDVPNGTTTATNYLLIEDTTTEPTTYAIYYHLAHDSIPVEIRTPGAEVYQGQLIGNADDTGASTAHHLHFMVHTNPNSYWGSSVDILFDEVDINDGRPRTCTEAELYPDYGDECHEGGDWFYSENEDNPPPNAWIESPDENTTITTHSFTAVAQAIDDMTVSTISMFLRQGEAGWQEVAETQNENTLTATINICDLGLEDGEFELAVEVVDNSQKVTGTYDTPHRLIKDVDCSVQPPACNPAPNQIALFTETNYQGDCANVDIGEYYGMVYVNGIENDEVSSLLVGDLAYVILYADNNLKGIHETFFTDDPDLHSNTIGNNTISSLVVGISPLRISYPDLPLLVSSYEGELIDISWSGSADEYYAELTREGESILIQDWTPETSFTLGYLATGTYTLSVTGRNMMGEAESLMTIEVEPAPKDRPETRLVTISNETTNSTDELEWEVIAGKSNIDHFEIQYRRDSGDWQLLNGNIPSDQSSTLSIFEPGYIYDFRMRAIAFDGLDENYPSTPEIRTHIKETCVPDLYELNSDSPIYTGESRLYTFCPTNDIDTVLVNANTSKSFSIQVEPLLNKLPISVTIYDPNGEIVETLSIYQKPSTLQFSPKSSQLGLWKIEFIPYDPLISGENTAYTVTMLNRNFITMSTTTLFLGLFGVVIILSLLTLHWIRQRKN